MTRSPTFQPVTGSASVIVVVAGLGGRAELDPGAAQRRAVEVHAAAAADDGRARFLVHAVEVNEANRARCAWRRSGRSGVPTSRAGRGFVGSISGMCASQSKPSSLASSPAWILIRPTSSRVSLSRAKVKRAGDVNGADRLVGVERRRSRCARCGLARVPAAGTLPPSQVAARTTARFSPSGSTRVHLCPWFARLSAAAEWRRARRPKS